MRQIVRRFPSTLNSVHQFASSGPNLVQKNELGIQLLPKHVSAKIFGQDETQNPNDATTLRRVKQHLSKHGFWDIKENRPSMVTQILPEACIDLPPLNGNTVEEHFMQLGEKQVIGYKLLAQTFCDTRLPQKPKSWSKKSGWTKYATSKNGIAEAITVAYPDDNVLIFDVETCVKQGNIPVMATAVSPNYWYSWISPVLFEGKQPPILSGFINSSELIPMGRRLDETLLIGHNVSFDRSFISEQSSLICDKMRFMDTMSMHICISGLTGYQRALSTSLKSAQRRGIDEQVIYDAFRAKNQPNPMLWDQTGSLNSLLDVYNFYCKEDDDFTEIEKETRNIFVEGSLDDIRREFPNLIEYCARDVEATSKVFKKQWPQFLERFPHPITLSGMLEMSIMYLPVNKKVWSTYIKNAQNKYDEVEDNLSKCLMKIANKSCRYLKEDKYKKDPWLWDLDWSTQEVKLLKENPKATKSKNILSQILKDRLQKNQSVLCGYPQWYRDLCEKPTIKTAEGILPNSVWKPDPVNISTQIRSVPKLMKLMWDGFALHFDRSKGWGYLVPQVLDPRENHIDDKFPYEEYIKIVEPEDIDTKVRLFEEGEVEKKYRKTSSESRPGFCPDVHVRGCKFFKLPHRNGYTNNVGNPLAKDFLRYIEEGRLTSFQHDDAHTTLLMSKQSSYWKMNSARIKSQQVLQINTDSNDECCILPRVVVAGTVTRRAVEPTWLTASNAYEDRIGSELKAMITAPNGYKFVGADVDSQELWIASLMGDSKFAGIHGSTGIGWMTLQGSKKDKTDMHSKTASLAEISRDEAKVLNYGRIYGAGKKFAARFLKLSNPKLSEDEAQKKAEKIYSETKGNKIQGKWIGGTESFMFNKLEEIAKSSQPSTPILDCRVSRALESIQVKNDFMTSLVNWVVQSSAVDFLHLLLVTMKWLFEVYEIDGRFSISIHDEVRYLVNDKDKYKAAYCLQIANLLTRSYFSYKLGIKNLPYSVAFFSSVDIDQCLRKEPFMDCKTPSNPLGLQVAFGISPGESLTMDELLERISSQTRKQEISSN